MATLRNKRKLAASSKENCEEHPRSNLAQNSINPRSQRTISLKFLDKLRVELPGRIKETRSHMNLGLKNSIKLIHGRDD